MSSKALMAAIDPWPTATTICFNPPGDVAGGIHVRHGRAHRRQVRLDVAFVRQFKPQRLGDLVVRHIPDGHEQAVDVHLGHFLGLALFSIRTPFTVLSPITSFTSLFQSTGMPVCFRLSCSRASARKASRQWTIVTSDADVLEIEGIGDGRVAAAHDDHLLCRP